jgi:hypothetical protein
MTALEGGLITSDWCVHLPAECEPQVEALFHQPELIAAAAIWLTIDEVGFGAMWTVVLQYKRSTYLEQRRYDRNPNGSGPPLHPGMYNEHWDLVVPGSFGTALLDRLRQRGLWEFRGKPIGREEFLDPCYVGIAAWHPHWGRCRVFSQSCDVFAGGHRASDLETVVWPWCMRSRSAFRRSARLHHWLGWLLQFFRAK